LTAAHKFLGDLWSKGKAEFELAKQAIDNMEVDEDNEEAAKAPKTVGFNKPPARNTGRKRKRKKTRKKQKKSRKNPKR
jgi:hypothetical protein